MEDDLTRSEFPSPKRVRLEELEKEEEQAQLKNLYAREIPSSYTEDDVKHLLEEIAKMEQDKKFNAAKDIFLSFTNDDTMTHFISLFSVWVKKRLLKKGILVVFQANTREECVALEEGLKVFLLLADSLTSSASKLLGMHILKLCFKLSFSFLCVPQEQKFVLLSLLAVLHRDHGPTCVDVPFLNMAVTLCRHWLDYAVNEKNLEDQLATDLPLGLGY